MRALTLWYCAFGLSALVGAQLAIMCGADPSSRLVWFSLGLGGGFAVAAFVSVWHIGDDFKPEKEHNC